MKRIVVSHLTKLFLSTLLVSFLGSLPLGTLNVSITNLSIHNGSAAAFAFGFAAILVELVLVRLAVKGFDRLERINHYAVLFRWLALMALLFFAAVSVASF